MIGPFTIAKLARATGFGVETIRFYERRGLISQPKRPENGGARDYGPEVIDRLQFIRQGKEIGFSLSEISELLELRDDGESGCEAVRERAITKRREIDEKLHALTEMRGVLDDLIARCPGQGNLTKCPILDAMESGGSDADVPERFPWCGRKPGKRCGRSEQTSARAFQDGKSSLRLFSPHS